MATAQTIDALCRLRMTPQEFKAYKIRQARLSYSGACANVAHFSITGYDAEAKAAIQACCGADTLRVRWRVNDNAVDITSRVESLLKIPMRHWGLATEGTLLDPGDPDPLSWYPPYQGCHRVELVLVPVHKVEDYAKMFATRSLHPIWKHLRPATTTEAESHDSLRQATAIFHLVHPTADEQWECYVRLRKAAEADFYGTLRTTRHLHKLHPVMTQIREGLTFVLKNTRLQTQDQLSLADGIIPLTLNVRRSKNVTDIEVYSRIHSATRPAAVDVFYLYRHRTLQNRVEFYCHVYFRISDPIASANHVKPNAHRWEHVFEMGTYCDSDESPPRRRWHPILQKKWGLDSSRVARIRTALFGIEDQCPANAVDKIDTVRLLLASVGIPYYVARAEDDEDGQEPRFARAVFWEWDDDDWIGLNVRKACEEPLKRDATWKWVTCRKIQDDEVAEATSKTWYVAKEEDSDLSEEDSSGSSMNKSGQSYDSGYRSKDMTRE